MSGLTKKSLSTTPTTEALSDLKLGDVVYLDGLMYTAREGVYMRALEERANIPMELPR
ncbi:MAG: fumarate hydratase, partial [Pseudomonadota bacterium]